MTSLRETLDRAHRALTAGRIDHALIGGFALAAHGINRATADIDFLADGTRSQEIKESLTKEGFRLVQETPEVLHFEGVGNLDILLANRPASREMLKKAQKNPRFSVLIVKPEDIIGLKIQAYKNESKRALQDKADIQSLIERHGSTIDWSQVKKYADLFGEWEEIKKLGARE